jgi:multidrug resistance efflux pump
LWFLVFSKKKVCPVYILTYQNISWENEKESCMTAKFLRISAALGLLIAAAFSIAPYATGLVSISAVVNAPVVSVDAPFDGVIETPSKAVVQKIVSGEEMFTIGQSRVFGSELRSLQSNLLSIEGEISSLQKQKNEFEDLRSELTERRDAQVAARLNWFEHRISEAVASSESAQALLNLAQERKERLNTLADRGMAPRIDELEAESAYESALAASMEAQENVNRLIVERDSISPDMGVDLSSNDMEQITYRLDEISVRNTDLNARISTLSSRKEALEQEIKGLTDEMNEQKYFSPVSSVSGVIWEGSGRPGTTVSRGQPVVEVLDCGLRFVEVELDERHFESVHPGDMARVQMVGSDEILDAKIVAIYGSGALPNQDMKAATPRISLNGGLRVIVLIGAADMEDERVVRSFCDVGRSAEVFFDLPEDSLIKRVKRKVAYFWPNTSEQEVVSE